LIKGILKLLVSSYFATLRGAEDVWNIERAKGMDVVGFIYSVEDPLARTLPEASTRSNRGNAEREISSFERDTWEGGKDISMP
jgi:hypothetical protein